MYTMRTNKTADTYITDFFLAADADPEEVLGLFALLQHLQTVALLRQLPPDLFGVHGLLCVALLADPHVDDAARVVERNLKMVVWKEKNWIKNNKTTLFL